MCHPQETLALVPGKGWAALQFGVYAQDVGECERFGDVIEHGSDYTTELLERFSVEIEISTCRYL
jgi:hypothetical protein